MCLVYFRLFPADGGKSAGFSGWGVSYKAIIPERKAIFKGKNLVKDFAIFS